MYKDLTELDIASGTPRNPISTNTTSPAEKKSGLTTEGIIGIAIGLPGAITAMITMIIYIRKQQMKRARRYNNMSATEKRPWWKFKNTVAAVTAQPQTQPENQTPS